MNRSAALIGIEDQMPPTNSLDRPLAPKELRELEAHLNSRPGAMTLIMAEGFLAAVASAPNMIGPSQWYPVLFGEHEHAFESQGDAEKVFGLLLRLLNQIAAGLNEGAVEWHSDLASAEVAEDWSIGYLTGARLDSEWTSDEYGWCAVLPLGVLARHFDLVGELNSAGEIIEDSSEDIERYRQQLPETVQDLHDYWVKRRRQQMAGAPPVRANRPGRNAPCPCGSGKKFKHCCVS